MFRLQIKAIRVPAKFTICQVTFLACFSVICYEKWPVLTKNNKKDGLQREGESSDRNFNYLSLINWSIFFFGNFMVTVLSSVEHAVTEACDLKNNSCLQYDRSPHKTIDRGLKVQAYILMAFYCQQSFLLMCLTLSCSEGLRRGKFTVDCVIFGDPPCRTRSSRFWIAYVPAITKIPSKCCL